MEYLQVVGTTAFLFVALFLLLMLLSLASLIWRNLPNWMQVLCIAVFAAGSIAWLGANF